MEDKKFIRRDTKLVFNAGCARRLLRAGCMITDIKQSKENADKTIFAFKADDHFWEEFEKLNKEISETKRPE